MREHVIGKRIIVTSFDSERRRWLSRVTIVAYQAPSDETLAHVPQQDSWSITIEDRAGTHVETTASLEFESRRTSAHIGYMQTLNGAIFTMAKDIGVL